MPLRQRKKKTVKRTYKRRSVIPRSVKSNKLVTQRTFNWSIIAGTGVNFGQALTLSLNSLPNASEYSNLFDRYCIPKVQYRWYIDVDPMVVTGTKFYPRITFAHDFTDSTVPTSQAIINEYPKRRIEFMGDSRQCTRWYTLKPAISDSVFGGGASTHYVPKWNQFIHTDNLSTPQYGLKTWVDNLMTGVSLVLEAKVTVILVNPK